jgi:hypothetical protein
LRNKPNSTMGYPNWKELFLVFCMFGSKPVTLRDMRKEEFRGPEGQLAKTLREALAAKKVSRFEQAWLRRTAGLSKSQAAVAWWGTEPLGAKVAARVCAAFEPPWKDRLYDAWEFDHRHMERIRARRAVKEAEVLRASALPHQLPALETEDERQALWLLLELISGSPWLLDPLLASAKALRKAKEA